MTDDERICDVCIASIRRHSMAPEDWAHTKIGVLHDEILEDVALAPSELVLVSCFISTASWYAITTRRIVGAYYGRKSDVSAAKITDDNFGNFKGYGQMAREVMTIRSLDTGEIRFEYETGNASMAPIYALNTLLPKLKSLQAEQDIADQPAAAVDSKSP
jgi:hypothetical protein